MGRDSLIELTILLFVCAIFGFLVSEKKETVTKNISLRCQRVMVGEAGNSTFKYLLCEEY